MAQNSPLKPDDFPVKVENQKLRTENDEPVAVAKTPELADQLADRLNEHAHQEEQDRWSA